ncbi:INO80 complex subunit C [Cochliomyia hominivorax]
MSEEIPSKKLKTEDNDCETKTNEQLTDNATAQESNSEATTISQASIATITIPAAATPQSKPKLSFKNPKYSYIEPGGKKFIWKSLKQIVTQEKSLPWPEDVVLYNSLNAPPSLKPAKKYSDISGLEAPYTDPQTKLHYHNAEEFRIIRTLPSDIIQGYLALRGATNIVG